MALPLFLGPRAYAPSFPARTGGRTDRTVLPHEPRRAGFKRITFRGDTDFSQTGHLEEQPTFDVDPFRVSANEMKNENQQSSEGQLTLACEMLRILFWMRAYTAGKESENIFNKSCRLARNFHACPVP